MAFMTFWALAVFVLDGTLPVSAHPVSIHNDVPIRSLSGVPQQEPAPNTAIPPHGLEFPLEGTATLVNGEAIYGNQLSKRNASETLSSGGGLSPDTTAGIAVGATFGTLFVIAAFMYAFRVGWKKGQKEKAKTTKKRSPRPPTSRAPESWNQMDVIKSPDAVLEIWSGYWEGENQSGNEEKMQKYNTLGGYSFRPEKGVYEIQEKDIKKRDDIQELWSTGGSSRTDSARIGEFDKL
jgi:hypothetical protein